MKTVPCTNCSSEVAGVPLNVLVEVLTIEYSADHRIRRGQCPNCKLDVFVREHMPLTPNAAPPQPDEVVAFDESDYWDDGFLDEDEEAPPPLPGWVAL